MMMVVDSGGGSEEKAAKPTVVNETAPLWKKDPKAITDDQYRDFFHHLYPMEPDPLFWLHLKIDHPFTLEGILYFPQTNPARPFHENNIKLYCKQVFVSDNVKDIVPEFLRLLKGAMDSVDIPLNVSRSSLQGDPNIKKISNYIVRKVADSLIKLHKNDSKKFEEIWPNTALFIKYGIISDPKFDELLRDRVLFKNSDDAYMALPEYKKSFPEKYREKLGDKILYFEKEKSDPTLRKQLQEEGIQAIETDETIDPHFMQHIENHKIGDQTYSFSSVDNEIGNLLAASPSDGESTTTKSDIKIKELFTKSLSEKEVEIEKLKNATYPAYFKTDEKMKRLEQMTRTMAMGMGQKNTPPLKRTLVINPNNPLIQNALKIHEKGHNKELVEKLCHHVKDLADISSQGLKNEDKETFVKRSQKLIQELSQLAL